MNAAPHHNQMDLVSEGDMAAPSRARRRLLFSAARLFHALCRFAPVIAVGVAVIAIFFAGCGTTKWTETRRTATEQLLISDAMDQAVGRIDFRALSGKTVYLDETYLKDVVDSAYLISSLRQQLLSHGAILKEKRDEADFILEVRSGSVGTDMHSVLIGVPQLNLPSAVSTIGLPTSFPEIPLVKKTRQMAVTKILLFAYNRKTGRPLWQSGTVLAKSDARDVWFFGAGPFQQGAIYDGTQFAGEKLTIDVPLIDLSNGPKESVRLMEEAYYVQSEEESKTGTKDDTASKEPEAATPSQAADKDTKDAKNAVVSSSPQAASPPAPSHPVFPDASLPAGPILGSPTGMRFEDPSVVLPPPVRY